MHIASIGIDLGKTTFHLIALGERSKVLVRKTHVPSCWPIVLDKSNARVQYGVIRHVEQGAMETFPLTEPVFLVLPEPGGTASAWLFHPKRC